MSAPYTLAQAIQAVRILANDTNVSHRVFPDSLTAQVDKIRTVFPLSNKNIQTGTRYVVDGGALASGDSLVTDFVNGIITMGSAPQSSLEWYYFYQDFTDPEITQFVDNGLAEVGMNESSLTAIDPTLYDVMNHFAAAQANSVRMERFAAAYNASIEGETFDKSSVYQAYQKAHDLQYKAAIDKRDNFYKRQSRQFSASSVVTTTNYGPSNQMPLR